MTKEEYAEMLSRPDEGLFGHVTETGVKGAVARHILETRKNAKLEAAAQASARAAERSSSAARWAACGAIVSGICALISMILQLAE